MEEANLIPQVSRTTSVQIVELAKGFSLNTPAYPGTNDYDTVIC